uniref:TF-B3 domain-containing protein n=1 Tax=Brachypodium sylvaticum TaxID=29664 RepID=C3TX84_BRASY|nr:unknown [Brachypodium sylvaticum]
MAAALSGGGVRRRKFFKVLLPGTFESCLWLPPKFAAGLDCPPGISAATLRDPAGRSWRVDLDRRGGGGKVCFAGKGWRRFVSGCGLSAGQFLVFDHLAGLDFAVDPFDASGCSLDLDIADPPVKLKDDDDTASRCHEETQSSGNKRKRKLSAVTTATTSGGGSCERGGGGRRRTEDDGETVVLRRRIGTPYELQCLDVSMGFCESLGWTTSRTAELVVDGRRWEVGVKVAAKGGMILRGWPEFAKDNGLRVADSCVFRPVHVVGTGDRFVQVQVFRGQA